MARVTNVQFAAGNTTSIRRWKDRRSARLFWTNRDHPQVLGLAEKACWPEHGFSTVASCKPLAEPSFRPESPGRLTPVCVISQSFGTNPREFSLLPPFAA